MMVLEPPDLDTTPPLPDHYGALNLPVMEGSDP
jgi:hypothetical protein